MPISTPDQIITPWASTGLKDAIPQTADPVNGRAGYDQGFPAINMAPKAAGGIPPFGQDFNGIFYDLTLAMQYLQAGGSFPYDGAWASAVGGYPIGALVSRSDSSGLWRNTSANNTTDPEAGGAGWQPEDAGATSITMTSSNVTLTPLQAARQMIIITGALTANLQLIFPSYVKQWLIVNRTTGSYAITCKTAAGSGVDIAQTMTVPIYGDGTNIGASAQTGTDYLNTLRIDVASAATLDLDVAAPSTRNIRLTGTATITGITVTAGKVFFVTFGGAMTLTNNANIVTNSGANISTAAGDSCILRATANNVVEVLCYTPGVRQAIGSGQTWQDVTGSRSFGVTYTNTTGRPIMVSLYPGALSNRTYSLTVNGQQIASVAYGTATVQVPMVGIIPTGATYQASTDSGTLEKWTELR